MAELIDILNSVKPKLHTERFRILAALFALGAASKAVSAGELNDILDLNLGNKKPKNLSTRLREYSKAVRVADRGPPLRWLLTNAGLSELREKTSLPLAIKKTDEDFMSDIGIICALEDPEFTAVINACGGMSRWKELSTARYSHVYRETQIATRGGNPLRVIV